LLKKIFFKNKNRSSIQKSTVNQALKMILDVI